MKISICDVCKKQDNKIIEAPRALKVKGNSMLNIDVCKKHGDKISKMPMVDYVRFIYKLDGLDLKETDQEIKQKFFTR